MCIISVSLCLMYYAYPSFMMCQSESHTRMRKSPVHHVCMRICMYLAIRHPYHGYYTLCTGTGNSACRCIYIIMKDFCGLYLLWLHEMTLSDLLPPQSISRLYKATVTYSIQFLIILCFCGMSKHISSGSFAWLAFSGCADLSWKGNATYIDGAYSEG